MCDMSRLIDACYMRSHMLELWNSLLLYMVEKNSRPSVFTPFIKYVLSLLSNKLMFMRVSIDNCSCEMLVCRHLFVDLGDSLCFIRRLFQSPIILSRSLKSQPDHK